MKEPSQSVLQNLKEKDATKKLKWYEPKEYRRIRAAYSIDYSQSKSPDPVEIMEKNERYFARQRNKKIQYI